jgi:hypothetical protein
MRLERILAVSAAGPLLGGLSWRPPRGGKHSMRRLYEARNLTVDATHYTLFSSDRATVYGLFQPRAAEEGVKLPKATMSAAQCFASLVGIGAPNAALVLTVPADEYRKDEKVYVVVLDDGVPVVDSLTTDMEARNALGSEDRPIWADNAAAFPNCEVVDFEWLGQGASKACRVLPIPINPWPLAAAAVVLTVGAGVWWTIQAAQQAEARRREAEEIAQNDPVPRYLAAMNAQLPGMASDRSLMLAAVRQMFDAPVFVPGWKMTATECSAAAQRCDTLWTRQGGTYTELQQSRPGETLGRVTPDGSPVPLLDAARTSAPASVARVSLVSPGAGLPNFAQAIDEIGPTLQVWRTADLGIDIKPPMVWPRVAEVPAHFQHPHALMSGVITLTDVPGPFILEALETAPGWISWESVRADIGDGDAAGRLKFKAMGIYYVSSR